MGHYNWPEVPEINLHNYSHLVSTKMSKTQAGGKRASPANSARKSGCAIQLLKIDALPFVAIKI
jgi:hypothetical protein